MPIHLPPHGTPDRIQWKHGRNAPMEYVLHSDVNGRPGTKNHQDGMQEAVQAEFDLRTPLADLSPDDEFLTADPEDNPKLIGRMWRGDADGKKVALATHIISRAVVVIVDSWDGAAYVCTTRRA